MNQRKEYTPLDFHNNWATIVGYHADQNQPLDVTNHVGRSLASGRVLLDGEFAPQSFREIQRTFRFTEHGPATDEVITTFSLDGPEVVITQEKWEQVMPPPKEGARVHHSRDPETLEDRRRDNAITRVSIALASLVEAERQLATNL